ncbi:MAG: hypothetical protein GY865_14810 [candidate division Zixibacteria bacterium]|nr:hypothetical protein [candidate division Zixibacteria bacterium]
MKIRRSLYIAIMLIIFCGIGGFSIAAVIADHNKVALFESIPVSVIDEIQDNYNLFYGHTSHGSQIMTGLNLLDTENPTYSLPTFHEISDDLGHNGDITWLPPTESWLDANPDYNIVMWSWCGGASDNTEEGINTYLSVMSQLELDYPTVKFIYMTGHLDGGGVDGNLYIRNNQIRDYCALNDKILFDFADIESYDPDGNYYPDETDACAWCSDWCATHTCDMCPASCAHSHCFNCYQKGKAFWWMMATITGWQVETGGCGDVNLDGTINILDIVLLINYVYKGGPAPAELNDADVNNDTEIDILDIVLLINYKYKSGPPPNCPE